MKTLVLCSAWLLSVVVAFFLGDYVELNRTTLIPTTHGRFLSLPNVTLLDERTIQLQEDFVYIDPNDDPWLAPKGRKVNGASIPKIFWSATGGPLSGKYRNASIVHDVECDDRKRDHKRVHLMFYHACLAGGVPEKEAKRLYWAVSRFGPRWVGEVRSRQVHFTGRDGEQQLFVIQERHSHLLPAIEPTTEDAAWAATYFDEHDPPVEIIPHIGDLSNEDR